MTRPLPIAACLALAVASIAALAQTAPPADTGQSEANQVQSSQAQAAEAQTAQTAQTDPGAPAPTTPAPATPAASQPQVEPTGSAQRGELLTYTCQGCHGVVGYKNVYPHYHVPLIGGQSEIYLVNTLNAYKQGTRQHPTMQAQAQSFSQQDIADIAAYLSELTP